MRVKSGLVAVALALACAACAGGGGPGFGDEEEHDGPPVPRSQLFISPVGQPFRSGPGEPYPVAAWFAQADANHDGKLTRDEFRADGDAWFTTIDTNKDGQVGMPEVTVWEETIPELARLGGLGIGMGGAEGRRADRSALKRNELNTRVSGAAAYSLINEPHPLRGADADFSMGVSRAEWRAAADRRFALLDPDGDGAVALIDLKPTPAQAMAGGPPGKGKGGGKGPPPRPH